MKNLLDTQSRSGWNLGSFPYPRRRRLCRGIERRRADLAERIAIGMVERFRLARDDQHGVLLVGPRSIGVDRNRDGVALRPERVLEERIRHDPIRLGATHGLEAE